MTKLKKTAKKKSEKLLYNASWIQAQVHSFAQEIVAQGVLDHALVAGIQRRGAELARRVCERVRELSKQRVPWGALDITLYRDDVTLRGPRAHASREGTQLDGPLDNRVVCLVDDVICTGRTIRAALDLLMDFGRPGAVRLYSVIDRGGRELPIQPERVGARVTVSSADRVEVRLKEVDGEEGVFVVVGGMR